MSLTVCLCGKTLSYPQGGGHLWAYLNWALGLRTLGCNVYWLEGVNPKSSISRSLSKIEALKSRLQPYKLDTSLALFSWGSGQLPTKVTEGSLALSAVREADLLLNLAGGIPADVISQFRRSALVDIDPGLFQIWMSKQQIQIAKHDIYFTIGETVGQPGALFSDCGVTWHYTSPCIALDWWPVTPLSPGASFSTVSNWYMDEWVEDANGWYLNDKRSGFLPFLNLPQYTTQVLELALCLSSSIGDQVDLETLRKVGWVIRNPLDVASTPWDYQRYIQNSKGEFSCAKPSCIKLQNAWISDRTLCYLASGKPAIVQHTGPSQFLPDSAGLFRFRSLSEAASYLDRVAADYEQQCKMSRYLAEE